MDWQKACNISQLNKAVRYEGNKKIVRDANGYGYTEIYNNFRDATFKELEGHLDWEPLD